MHIRGSESKSRESASLDVSVSLGVGMVGAAALLPLVSVGSLTLDNVMSLGATVWLFFRLLTSGRTISAGVLGTVASGCAVLSTAALIADLYSDYWPPLGAVRFVSYVLLALWANGWRSREIDYALHAVISLGAILACSVWLQVFGLLPKGFYVTIHDLESTALRYGGLIGHPNFAGAFLGECALLVILAVRNRWLLALFLGLDASAILVTGARAVVLGLALGIGIVTIRQIRLLVPVLLVIVLGWSALGSALTERFTFLSSTGGITGDNAAGWRFHQWRNALEAARSHFPFGVGWNHFKDISVDGLAVHSGFLELWVELGVLGAVGGVLVVAGAARVCATAQTRGATSMVVYLISITVSDPGLFYPPIALAFILMAPWLCGMQFDRDGFGTGPRCTARSKSTMGG